MHRPYPHRRRSEAPLATRVAGRRRPSPPERPLSSTPRAYTRRPSRSARPRRASPNLAARYVPSALSRPPLRCHFRPCSRQFALGATRCAWRCRSTQRRTNGWIVGRGVRGVSQSSNEFQQTAPRISCPSRIAPHVFSTRCDCLVRPYYVLSCRITERIHTDPSVIMKL